MKIRIKVLLTSLVSLAIALFCTFFIVKTLLVGYIEKEEISIVQHNCDKAVSILQREEGSLRGMGSMGRCISVFKGQEFGIH